ncbi:hypothetical protein SRB5_66030 [Streptomyces sp. RB5]|uniref:Uncharacterized protein n=1 Tax=Streptomyces smaragdinus TaxID=2585196 RepID=A0A7K0CUP4_9ACTN|nr:hypothetical protein [Streptomyces smaragdinus]MQY16404.1 hypothetical protein [Streptomyces smaragdinus]
MGENFWTAFAALAGVIGNVIAIAIAVVTLRQANRALSQAYAIDGAGAAIAWREQVIALHDRGLTPDEIRSIMLLEDGGEGYERSNGRINDILAAVPRCPPS